MTNRPLLITPFFTGLVLLLLLNSGCEETVAEPTVSPLESYYPLALNRPVYYRIDSVVLSGTIGGIVYDSSSSEARETLVETFLGADGTTLYRGERWVRGREAEEFRFQQTFTVDRSGGVVRRSEDNLTFTKLVLPFTRGLSWDGNAAFDEQRSVAVGGEFLDVYNGWNYRYSSLDTSLTLSTGVQLDSVVTVTQASESNLIDLRQAYERYAPGIGLVERFVDARHTQCRVCCGGNTAECINLPWNDKAEKGYIIRQTFLRKD